ncbi:MAG: 4Fe-4S dicluster domain-containing protein [Gemmatimonadetes bacterium]|nr:4Fe-4S dicluster domain-containing protein [Gemmatimonadota bacterium]
MIDRRELLKTLCVAGGAAVVGKNLSAEQPAAGPAREAMGVLVDTTKCIGCRMCEFSCADAHKDAGLEFPEDVDFTAERATSEKQWTVVNRYETDRGQVYAKKQCLHCLQPACASACLTRAMHKTPAGPVAWTANKCMGCRFCMVSCPFDMPKFEYDSAVPRIQKCVLCWERLEEGKQPACVESCPSGALSFGPRAERLEEARRRIYAEPDKYVHHVYGEHEAGGTSWLYLASVPFEQIGLPTDVGDEPYPALTREFLYSVPFVEILVPTFLLALSAATKREKDREAAEANAEGEV